MDKKKRFNKILEDIEKVKIQGARNIAKAALYAYSLNPIKSAKKKLISARVTEPMLINTLKKFEKIGYRKTLSHFDEAQEKINKLVSNLLKSGDVIFTHCHSTNVINALIHAKKLGKKFEVYNTETRPLFQGRETTRQLRKAGIKVTTFIDAAARIALLRVQKTKKTNLVFFGADAILKDGVINKIGSGMFAEIAYDNQIPVYIIADSWKYSSHYVKIEERDFHEMWKQAHRFKMRNPAFEKISKKYIKAIVSELGNLSYKKFLKAVKKQI